MDPAEKGFREAILNKLKEKLRRKLTSEEIKVFEMPRSLMGYEFILDDISDEELSTEDLERYVKRVVREYLENN